MTGDAEDMWARLRLTLPTHWFADSAPVMDSLLHGLSSAWVALYSLLQFVKTQCRIGTATNGFLDMAAQDYFGESFARRTQETDDAFRARLLVAMQRSRATRQAVIDAAAAAGFTVQIFEAARPADTGAYNVAARLAWTMSGGWGSLEMPFQSLIVAKPNTNSYANELWPGVAEAMPAGGVGWLQITG